MIFLLKKRNEVEISMSFIEWFLSNWYANCFTIITVVLSGLISLIISAVYYRKGNRNNLLCINEACGYIENKFQKE